MLFKKKFKVKYEQNCFEKSWKHITYVSIWDMKFFKKPIISYQVHRILYEKFFKKSIQIMVLSNSLIRWFEEYRSILTKKRKEKNTGR